MLRAKKRKYVKIKQKRYTPNNLQTNDGIETEK